MGQRVDGRFSARKMVNGKRFQGYGRTQEEADADLARKLHPIQEPTLTGSSTLREFAREAWFPRIAGKPEETKGRYMAAYRHIDATFGMTPLERITPQLIQRFVNELGRRLVSRSGKGTEKHPMDTTTVRYTAHLLASILNLAEQMDVIAKTPFRRAIIDLPKKKPKRERHLTPDAAVAMLEAAPPRLKCAVFLAAFLGLRRGEVCGLRWDDVDRLSGSIRIMRQKNNRKKNAALKSTSARRTLIVPPALIEALDRFGDLDSDRPVPYSGSQITHFWSRWEGRPDGWTFHDLRHGAASLIAYLTGGDFLAVQAILGHSKPDMTMTYIADGARRTGAAFEAVGGLLKRV